MVMAPGLVNVRGINQGGYIGKTIHMAVLTSQLALIRGDSNKRAFDC